MRNDIPEHTKEMFMNYFNHCYEPGSFGMAVLRNDLIGAVSRADHINRAEISSIVLWLVNNAPYGSYGDNDTIRDWLNKGPHQQRYEKQRLIDILSTEVSE